MHTSVLVHYWWGWRDLLHRNQIKLSIVKNSLTVKRLPLTVKIWERDSFQHQFSLLKISMKISISFCNKSFKWIRRVEDRNEKATATINIPWIQGFGLLLLLLFCALFCPLLGTKLGFSPALLFLSTYIAFSIFQYTVQNLILKAFLSSFLCQISCPIRWVPFS